GLGRPYPGQAQPDRDSARLWHLASGREITAITGPAGVWPDVLFAPDGSWFATQDRRGVICLRDTTDGRVRGELAPADVANPGPRTPARWRPFTVSPDGRVIACWSEPPRPPAVQLYDTATGRPTVALDGAAEPIAFSADGRTLASGLGDGELVAIALWDVNTGRAIDRFGEAASRPGAI